MNESSSREPLEYQEKIVAEYLKEVVVGLQCVLPVKVDAPALRAKGEVKPVTFFASLRLSVS